MEAQAEYNQSHDRQNAHNEEMGEARAIIAASQNIATTEHGNPAVSKLCDALSPERSRTRQCSLQMQMQCQHLHDA